VVFSQVAPLRSRVERRLLALSSLRGHSPAQEIMCPGWGSAPILMPISEMITCAVRSLTPGMVRNRRTACRKRVEIAARTRAAAFGALHERLVQHEDRGLGSEHAALTASSCVGFIYNQRIRVSLSN
jgi:hypothetical protein